MSQDLEDELRAAVTAYNDGTARLRAARDEAIRKAATGMRQTDIVRITGYNRETIRLIVKAGKESDDE